MRTITTWDYRARREESVMPEILITVQKVQPPEIDAAGRRFGAKIYDTAGNKYTINKAMVGMFTPGGRYDVFYEDKTYQGNAYKEVKTVKASTAPLEPAPESKLLGHSQQEDRSTEIWCNSMMQRAIAHEKLDPWSEEACVEFCEIQKRVHGRVFHDEPAVDVPQHNNGPSPQTRAHPETADAMSDEIPF